MQLTVYLACWDLAKRIQRQAVKTLKRLKTCTFNLGNCSLSVSSHAMVSITASYSTTFHYMQGIDTFIKNWFVSIRVVSISKAYFYFLLSKAYIIIIVIIRLHSANTPTVRNLNYGKIIQCTLSLKLYTLLKLYLCLIFPGLWMRVRRMVISIYSKLLALTKHWWLLYVERFFNLY